MFVFVDLERLKFGWFESSPGNIKRNLRLAKFSSRISKSLYVPRSFHKISMEVDLRLVNSLRMHLIVNS